jgi:hypothetical protein
MIKCCKCELEATYDIPDNLCDYHWAEWWVSGADLTEEQRKQYLAETLEEINRQNKTY